MSIKSKIFNSLLRIDGIRIAFIDNVDGLAKSRRNIFSGAIYGGMWSSITGGVFTTGLILLMLRNESVAKQNSFLGIITIVSLACGLTQFISPLIMERFKKRKSILLYLRAVYHLFNIILLGVVPVLPVSLDTKLLLFIIILVIASLIANISASAFSVWHISDLPDQTRTHYFSIINMISPIITSLLATGASFYIDKMEADGQQYIGLMILRIISVVFAILEIYAFTKVKEPVYAQTEHKNIFMMLILPFKTPAYLLTVSLILVYSFGANFMGQYFTAYLLDDVKLSYAIINGISMLNIPFALLMYPVWSWVIRKTSWMKTLCIGGFLYCAPYILNAFTTKSGWILFILSCLSAYLISPALNLVFSNIPYMNIPKENQTAYISFYSTVSSLSGLIGSVIAKNAMLATEGKQITLIGVAMQNRQYMNFIPCVMLLIMVAVALYIEKRGKQEQG